MRLPNLIFYTATALAAGSLAAQANGGIEPDPLALSPELDSEAGQSFLDPSTEISSSSDRLPQHLDATPEAIARSPEGFPPAAVTAETLPSLPETATDVVPEITIADNPVLPEIETEIVLSDSAMSEIAAATPDPELEITATPSPNYDIAPESFPLVPESATAIELAPVETATEISTTVQALQPNEKTGEWGIESRSANLSDVVASTSDCETTEGTQLAQAQTTASCPRPRPYRAIAAPEPYEFESSPALSIYIPVGYGTEKNAVFLTGNYQGSVRNDPGSVANGGIGVGLGDAKNAVGVELSYAAANNPNAGEGGFNAKIHRRVADDLSVAVGWNGFLNIGRHDWEHSLYGVATKVFRTQDSLDKAFSRVAVTAGVGSNQFRSNGARRVGDNNANVFGNVAVRVLRPVSLIAEWTGQDLGLGLSIAPIRNFPLVITPAVRDLAGNEFRPRFVLTGGMAFRF